MRVLIVDENADFRLVLAEYLREGHANATAEARGRGHAEPSLLAIREWNPAVDGLPRQDEVEAQCDAILIDSHLEPADPVTWLTGLRAALSRLPPVVMLTSGRDAEELIASAMRLGVSGCLSRLELTSARLYRELAEAIEERREETTIERSLVTGVYGAARAPSRAARPPQGAPRIAGYRIERLIGEGGTASVYLARREADGLQLVLKVLLPEYSRETSVVERFMQEFSLVQKIQSAYVTRVFDLHYDAGSAYLAMEYFGAGDLRERLKKGFTALQAIKLFTQLARGLEAIHAAGIVHRDVKPHNVMFRDQHHLAIVDFGGAKALGETGGITKVGQIVGTPNYMSPEQILGQPLDARSDLYSLGVILHQLLTGRTLYQASSTPELMELHIAGPIPRLPAEFAALQTLFERLVAKNRDDRFASARELYAYIAA
jgi:tRNA A-37 threonylcarbamoyl transferase component Bud32/CheY-like chemotaxis protein